MTSRSGLLAALALAVVGCSGPTQGWRPKRTDPLPLGMPLPREEARPSRESVRADPKPAPPRPQPQSTLLEVRPDGVEAPRPSPPAAAVLSVASSERRDPNWLYALGRTELLRGHFRRAEELFNKAIAEQPDVADYYYRRALACAELGKDARAELDMARAASLDPRYTQDERIVDQVADVYRDRARAAVKDGKSARLVLRDFARARELNPDSPENARVIEALRARTETDIVEERDARAIADVRALRELIPGEIETLPHARLYTRRGVEKMESQLYADAVVEFERALACLPEHAEAADNRVLCLQRLEATRIEASPRKVSDDPSEIKVEDIDAVNYEQYLGALEGLQQRREAMRAGAVEDDELERVLKALSQLERAIWKASMKAAKSDRGNPEVAWKHMQVAVRTSPSQSRAATVDLKTQIGADFAKVLVLRANDALEDEAAGLLRRALEIDPQSAEAKARLAAIEARQRGGGAPVAASPPPLPEAPDGGLMILYLGMTCGGVILALVLLYAFAFRSSDDM